jgi:hypothetical protein
MEKFWGLVIVLLGITQAQGFGVRANVNLFDGAAGLEARPYYEFAVTDELTLTPSVDFNYFFSGDYTLSTTLRTDYFYTITTDDFGYSAIDTRLELGLNILPNTYFSVYDKVRLSVEGATQTPGWTGLAQIYADVFYSTEVISNEEPPEEETGEETEEPAVVFPSQVEGGTPNPITVGLGGDGTAKYALSETTTLEIFLSWYSVVTPVVLPELYAGLAADIFTSEVNELYVYGLAGVEGNPGGLLLGIGAEYQISSQLSAFIDVKNVGESLSLLALTFC